MSIHGGGTGGRSGESGWTMYIGSHISGTDHDCGHSGEEHYSSYHNNYGNRNSHQRGVDADSDDSMASDASSGPSHQELPCVSGEGRRRTDPFKHTNDDEHSSKSYSGKSEKQAKQRDERRMKKPEKEKPSTHNHKDNSAASFFRSKARKNK